MTPAQRVALEALRASLHNLEETIGKIHFMLLSAPNVPRWNEFRDEVSALDSIADVMRQALDSMEPDQ
jgi:hypothetical protein